MNSISKLPMAVTTLLLFLAAGCAQKTTSPILSPPASRTATMLGCILAHSKSGGTPQQVAEMCGSRVPGNGLDSKTIDTIVSSNDGGSVSGNGIVAACSSGADPKSSDDAAGYPTGQDGGVVIRRRPEMMLSLSALNLEDGGGFTVYYLGEGNEVSEIHVAKPSFQENADTRERMKSKGEREIKTDEGKSDKKDETKTDKKDEAKTDKKDEAKTDKKDEAKTDKKY